MAKLYGTDYTRGELLRRVGDISQVARARPARLAEGREEGVLAVDVATGSGLEFTVLPSRGMDISLASYKGMALAWRSATGEAHPSFYEPHGAGWLRGFYGGLVSTCGLTYAGAPNEDEGEELGLHGRAGYLPATNVSWGGEWYEDDYSLFVSGRLREASVFGPNVALERTITAELGGNAIFIHDRVENMGFAPVEHQLLYHINLGWPLLDEGARFVTTADRHEPRDERAAEGLADWAQLAGPLPDYAEQVYYHTHEEPVGEAAAALINDRLGLALAVRWDLSQLDRLVQWKQTGEGHYVMGIEPANCWVGGRAAERAAGTLQFLEPGEEREYSLVLEVLDGADAIAAFENGMAGR